MSEVNAGRTENLGTKPTGREEWKQWYQDKSADEVIDELSRLDTAARMVGKDMLTELSDRNGVYLMVPQLRAEAFRDGDSDLLVVFTDIDGLKAINDSEGHDVGDALLVETGRRLKRAVRGEDLVARLGGDEFVVVGKLSQKNGNEVLENRIRKSLSGYVQENGVKEKAVSASVGSFVLKRGEDFDAALKKADQNMYQEKQAKKGNPINGQ